MIDSLKNESVFFVTPDVKRGLGLTDLLPNFHIICSYPDPLIGVLRKQGAKIFCLHETGVGGAPKINNSGKILENPITVEYINKNTRGNPGIMYFKPSVKLDYLIFRMGYKPVGNSAEINEKFENKIFFTDYLNKNLSEYAVPSFTAVLGQLSYVEVKKILGERVVIQFGHGWAGKTTFFIEREPGLDKLKSKFPQTGVRVSKKIEGITVLNNCCIFKDRVFISPPAIQISGIKILHENPAVTCGRQWPAKFISEDSIRQINNISVKVGERLIGAGFRGIFGLDMIVEASSGRVYLMEINARMTASTPFFTRLQLGAGQIPFMMMHICAFLGVKGSKIPDDEYKAGISGSQITFRKEYPGSPVSGLPEFGVYKTEKGELIKTGGRYYPERLGDKELIIVKRGEGWVKPSDGEYFRMETGSEVLQTPGSLSNWVTALLNCP